MSKVIQSLELSEPVQDMGEEVKFIDIIKPTVGIFREANKKAGKDENEMGMLIAEKCSGLSPKGFAELSLQDALAIIEVIAPFLSTTISKN